jgi:SAM-dependent methyltransferase
MRERAAALGLRTLEVVGERLETYRPATRSFDRIAMLAVINHLDERSARVLDVSPEARAAYRGVLRPLVDWLRPGGQLVASDASRHHAFEPLVRMGLLHGHPLHPRMEWDKHQPPGVWKALLRDVGFVEVRHHWATNHRYPWMPRWLTDNVVAAHLNAALFVIRARAPQAASAFVPVARDVAS